MIINAETNQGRFLTPMNWDILQCMGYDKKDLDIDGDLVLEDTVSYERIIKGFRLSWKGGE